MVKIFCRLGFLIVELPFLVRHPTTLLTELHIALLRRLVDDEPSDVLMEVKAAYAGFIAYSVVCGCHSSLVPLKRSISAASCGRG